MDTISRLVQSPLVQDNLTRLWLMYWVAVLVAIVAGASVARSAFSSALRTPAADGPGTMRLGAPTPITRVAVVLFTLFLAAYVFALAYKADFALYDNDIFTDYVLRGRFYPPPVWPDLGRFFPLGHQEWNVLTLFTQSGGWYFALLLVELLVVVLLLYYTLRDFPNGVFILGTVLVLTAPSVARAFSTPSLPERNLVALILVFVLAFKAYARAPSGLTAAAVLVVVHCTLYYKEPAFLIFALFSSLRVVHGLLAERGPGMRAARGLAERFALDLAILLLCALFLASYAVVYLSGKSLDYAAARAVGSREALLYYFRGDLLLWVFLFAGAGRLLQLLRKRQAPDAFWDYLAAGTFGYFAFFVAIGLVNDYFLAPLHVVAVLYAITTLRGLWRRRSRAAVAAVIFVCVVQNVSATSNMLLTRLNVIEARTQLLRFLLEHSDSTAANQVRMHFPFVRERHVLYYLSCFFNYKAPRMGMDDGGGRRKPVQFVLTSPLEFRRNVCVSWNRDHQCFHADAARPGDLTVVLPEDTVPDGYLVKRKERGELLFQYQPFPAGAGTQVYVFGEQMRPATEQR